MFPDYNYGLKKLDLRNNAWGDNIIKEIVHALSYDWYVRNIDIRGNKVTSVGVKMIKKCL
jgi:hypothetical protein